MPNPALKGGNIVEVSPDPEVARAALIKLKRVFPAISVDLALA